MNFKSGVIEAIGGTPLIRLRAVSEQTGCEIFGKAEFLNPGQSVKDRAALFIIRDAEKRGQLKPGGTIVEGTAGNTGIGLALVGNALGYSTVIVIPDTQSQDKKDMLRLIGATLIEVPAVPYTNPNNYIRVSGRIAKQLASRPNGSVWANQFDNTANRDAHYQTTGPEIWADTDGKIDGFVCAMGTGGTIAGTSKALKERNADIVTALADPGGSGIYSFLTSGVFDPAGTSLTEGIGNNRETANLKGALIDEAYKVSDEEALPYIYDLLKNEGLCVGSSSAINIAGAVRLAEKLGPGHVIVTILADYGTRYREKLFNPEFLRSKNLPVPDWLEAASDVDMSLIYQDVDKD
ncbi:MAG: cysteine synthase A [Fimbriimonadaceae bacterium]|nr:cysteine synthase A [Alphaproteobacteria bacterium]